MGLIAAALNSVGGNLADQWKEFFYCDSISKDVLVVKGKKKTNDRSSNTKGDDNCISNGSGIAVADGQCMIIVEDGKVVEVCAQPGNFTYDNTIAPTVFTGNLWSSIKDTFSNIGQRISYGGIQAHDQRVYYFNTKEIMDNKIGTPSPVPFNVYEPSINFHYTMNLRLNGIYSYRIADPLLFYTNVCGNVSGDYSKSNIESQIKSELLSALQPALGEISESGVQYYQITTHTTQLKDALKKQLNDQWAMNRGIELLTFNVNAVNADPEDEKVIKEAQKNVAYGSNAASLAGIMATSNADAMKMAASNTAGAMTGFMGMGMAQQAGGMGNVADLFAAGQQQNAAKAAQAAQAADGWTCTCGTQNTGKFCMNCGSPKPAPAESWTCTCGTQNTGKFCMNCGQPKPASNDWTCECGTVNTGKFCMNCGKARP